MVAILVLTLLGGCRESSQYQVSLNTRPPPEDYPFILRVEAQVAGPLEGLRFRWYAVSGQCQPQESLVPQTVFRFADGVERDRITLEVWNENRRVALGEMNVHIDSLRRPRPGALAGAGIEITTIPPADIGGPDSRADIAGTISGDIPPGYRVAVYAYAYGTWFVQPNAEALHAIQPDGSWSTWTHTGSSYAALLVAPDFHPPARLDMLPPLGGLVAARVAVDGVPVE